MDGNGWRPEGDSEPLLQKMFTYFSLSTQEHPYFAIFETFKWGRSQCRGGSGEWGVRGQRWASGQQWAGEGGGCRDGLIYLGEDSQRKICGQNPVFYNLYNHIFSLCSLWDCYLYFSLLGWNFANMGGLCLVIQYERNADKLLLPLTQPEPQSCCLQLGNSSSSLSACTHRHVYWIYISAYWLLALLFTKAANSCIFI